MSTPTAPYDEEPTGRSASDTDDRDQQPQATSVCSTHDHGPPSGDYSPTLRPTPASPPPSPTLPPHSQSPPASAPAPSPSPPSPSPSATSSSPPRRQQIASSSSSLVPPEFRRDCDAVFATLAKLGGGAGPEHLATADAAEGAWMRYGEGADVARRLLSMVERGGPGQRGVSQAGFALGCYLLASRKPGVAMGAPRFCSVNQFIDSGFSSSKKLQLLCSVQHKAFYTFLSLILSLNTFFGLVSLLYWVLAPASAITCCIAAYLYYFYNHFSFLYRNTPLVRSLLAFGILGPIFLMGGFTTMTIVGDRNVNNSFVDDNAIVWGFTYLAWASFQIVYMCLSTVFLCLVLKSMSELSGSEIVAVPEIVVPQPGTKHNKKVFRSGMILLSVTGILLFSFATWGGANADTRWLAAILVWAIISPLSITSLGLMADCVRREYCTLLSVVGLLISIAEVLSPLYIGLPLWWYS
ncbi:hypothetical protein Pelo_13405 [Pelomyxa schiedti]|nr:hypothetical protein Pelo_13405 [Pelomyxa schiedti]